MNPLRRWRKAVWTGGVVTSGLALCALAQPGGFWTELRSGSTASLRGLSAVDARVTWASGSTGTVLRTADGGQTWDRLAVPGGAALDFRSLRAFDAQHVVLMSAGPGATSRVYRTSNGGAAWTLALQNRDANGFYDAIGFWDTRRGLLLGDPVDGRFTVLRTHDGGASWQRVPTAGLPAANPDEGAFAASGTCLVTAPGGHAWFGTGGVNGGRVFHSSDWGETWSVTQTPLRHDGPSAGVFSLAFRDARYGVAAGGDYQKLDDAQGNFAITEDGGATWRVPRGTGPGGFRSAVAFVADRVLVATGPAGTDVSSNGGESWTKAGAQGYHALSVTADGSVWASGANGKTGRADRRALAELVHSR